MSSFIAPLADLAVGAASRTADVQRKVDLLDQAKTVAESAAQLMYATKEGGGNPQVIRLLLSRNPYVHSTIVDNLLIPTIGALVVDSSYGRLVRRTLLPREKLRDDPDSIWEMAVIVVGRYPCLNILHYSPGLKVIHLSIF